MIFCKKKILFLILLSIRCFLNSDLCFAQQYPFQDTTLDIETRVNDLIGRLSIDEKLSLLEHQNPAIPRLGLKPYSWWNEALHGVGRNGTATVWPMPIALAASFDSKMVENIFSQVAAEGKYQALPEPVVLDTKHQHFPRPTLGTWYGNIR